MNDLIILTVLLILLAASWALLALCDALRPTDVSGEDHPGVKP